MLAGSTRNFLRTLNPRSIHPAYPTWPLRPLAQSQRALDLERPHIQCTACNMQMNAATSVRVSRETLAELERFQRALRTATADETIRAVLKMQRAAVIGRLSGSLRGRVTRFGEADRLDSDR